MFSKYICSYLKQKKIVFFRKSIIKKNKGGAGDLVGEKRTFLGKQKFLVRWGGRRVQKSAGCQFRPCCTLHFKEFQFQWKTKKVMLVESYVMPKNQKSWLPPPLWHSMSVFSRFVLRCTQNKSLLLPCCSKILTSFELWVFYTRKQAEKRCWIVYDYFCCKILHILRNK